MKIKRIISYILTVLVLLNTFLPVYADDEEEFWDEYMEETEITGDKEADPDESIPSEPSGNFKSGNAFEEESIFGELYYSLNDFPEDEELYYEIFENTDFFADAKLPGDKVSRADACRIFAKMLLGSNTPEAIASSFHDVLPESEYCLYIESIKNLGIIEGSGTGYFYPDNPVTYAELSKMLVKMINTDYAAEAKGGYFAGYTVVCNELDIFDGINISSTHVTYGDLAHILYNMLDIELMENVYYRTDIIKYGGIGVTFSDVMNLYHGEGIVFGDEFNSLAPNAEKDCLYIDGENYKADGGDYTGLYGMNTEYFYTLGKGGEKTLIMLLTGSEFEVIKIKSADILSANDKEFCFYSHESRKDISENIADAILFYNGSICKQSAVEPMVRRLINTDNGHVNLISDGNAVAIHVWNYDTYRAIAVNPEAEVIYAQNIDGVDFKLELSMYDDYKVLLNGSKAGLEGIKKDRVIMLASDTDGKKLIIECFNDKYKVSGKIEGVSHDGKTSYLIDGNAFEANSRYLIKNESKLKVNSSVKFYLDKYNHIVFHDFMNDTSEHYGYMINVKKSKDLNGTVDIRMLDETGMINVYSFSDKVNVTYPSDKYSTSVNERRLNAGESITNISGIVSPDGEVMPQLIKYSLDDQGRINTLKLAKNDFLFKTVPVRDYDSFGNVLQTAVEAEDLFVADYEIETVPVGSYINVTDPRYGQYPFGIVANSERSYGDNDFVRCYTNFDVAKYVDGDGNFAFYKFNPKRGIVKYTGSDESGDFSDSYTNLPGYMYRYVSSNSVTGIVYSVDSRYMITNETRIFTVPAKVDETGTIRLDGSALDEAYSVADLNAFSSKQYCQMQLFDVDENNFVKAMILIDRNSMPLSLETANQTGVLPVNCVVASKPTSVLSGGDAYIKLQVYEKGILRELLMPADSDYRDDGRAMRHFDKDGNFAGLYGFGYSFDGNEKKAEFKENICGMYEGTSFAQLKPGDVLRYSTDSHGMVRSFTVVFSYGKASCYGYYEDALAPVNSFGNLSAQVNINLAKPVSLKNGSATYVSSERAYVFGKSKSTGDLTASTSSITIDTRLLSLALYPRFSKSASPEQQYVVYTDNYSTIASVPVERTMAVSDSARCYLYDAKTEEVSVISFDEILPGDEVFWAQANSSTNGLTLIIRK